MKSSSDYTLEMVASHAAQSRVEHMDSVQSVAVPSDAVGQVAMDSEAIVSVCCENDADGRQPSESEDIRYTEVAASTLVDAKESCLEFGELCEALLFC